MPQCQNHNVTWILTQSKDGGTSTNNESHYFRKQCRCPLCRNQISVQSRPKSSGDLGNLPVAGLVPSAFVFYNQGRGGSSALLASGSYVRQSNQRIAAVATDPNRWNGHGPGAFVHVIRTGPHCWPDGVIKRWADMRQLVAKAQASALSLPHTRLF